MELTSIFVTGLFAGGLTCLAVQGGLLASSVAHGKEEDLKNKATKGHLLPITAFLIARLTSYTLLGFMLGMFGSILQLSVFARAMLQAAVAIFMIGTALNLFQIHPIFRYFVIQPPKFLTRMVKKQSKSNDVFGPALLGAMTVFIPCGATQAMMAYALSTGSSMQGALVMFIFILGTSPLFFIMGYAVKKIGLTMGKTFDTVVASLILLIGLYNLSGAFALSGSNFSYTKTESVANLDNNTDTLVIKKATIYFNPTGYTTNPQKIYVKAGSTIELDLVNKTGHGCIQAFTIPKLNVQRVVPVGKVDQITITAPKQPGELAFMCSMGMYRGSITVM